jgi:AraC-like DNA-binding protein
MEVPAGFDDWSLILFHDPCPVLCRTGLATVPAESVVLFEPRVPTAYGAAGVRVRHTWLRCRSAALAGWLRDEGLLTRTPIPGGDPAAHRAWWGLVQAEMSAPVRDRTLVAELLRLYLRRLARPAGSELHPGVARALRHLENHIAEPHDLASLARLAGMSRTWFATCFAAACGRPPLAYLQHLRLQHARSLLADPGLAVAEVAARCGYGDPFAFSKAFRRRYGRSPRRWRTQQGRPTAG